MLLWAVARDTPGPVLRTVQQPASRSSARQGAAWVSAMPRRKKTNPSSKYASIAFQLLRESHAGIVIHTGTGFAAQPLSNFAAYLPEDDAMNDSSPRALRRTSIPRRLIF